MVPALKGLTVLPRGSWSDPHVIITNQNVMKYPQRGRHKQSVMGFEEGKKRSFLMEVGDLKRLHENKTTKKPVLKNRSNFNRDRKESSKPRS